MPAARSTRASDAATPASRNRGIEERLSHLEGMFTRFLSQWDEQREDHQRDRENLHREISGLAKSIERKTEPKGTPWVVILTALGMGASILMFTSTAMIQPLQREMSIRFERNEMSLIKDHDATVRNNERWRLWEAGLLATNPDGGS